MGVGVLRDWGRGRRDRARGALDVVGGKRKAAAAAAVAKTKSLDGLAERVRVEIHAASPMMVASSASTAARIGLVPSPMTARFGAMHSAPHVSRGERSRARRRRPPRRCIRLRVPGLVELRSRYRVRLTALCRSAWTIENAQRGGVLSHRIQRVWVARAEKIDVARFHEHESINGYLAARSVVIRRNGDFWREVLIDGDAADGWDTGIRNVLACHRIQRHGSIANTTRLAPDAKRFLLHGTARPWACRATRSQLVGTQHGATVAHEAVRRRAPVTSTAGTVAT